MNSEEEPTKTILSYWTDVKFSAAFAGVSTLRMALKHELGLNFSVKQVQEALLSVPNYVMKIRRASKFLTRPYWVTGSFLEWSVDLGFMKPLDGRIGYLLAIDAFSKRLYAEVIHDRKNSTIVSAFKRIFKEKTGNLLPSKIEVRSIPFLCRLCKHVTFPRLTMIEA